MDAGVIIYGRNMFIIQATGLLFYLALLIRTPQFGPSLTDDTRVIIYDRNMFIIQATGLLFYLALLISDATVWSVTY